MKNQFDTELMEVLQKYIGYPATGPLEKNRWIDAAIEEIKQIKFIHNALSDTYEAGYVHGALDTSANAKKGIGVIDTMIERQKPIKTPEEGNNLHMAVIDKSGNREVISQGIPVIKSPSVAGVIKTPKDAEKAVASMDFDLDEQLKSQDMTMKNGVVQKLCKIHGTPLDDRGRCLTKGCRYG